MQFVDGDCEVVEGWVERACRELEGRPEVAVVCGRRRERFPEKSIYNRLADLEWDTPVGEVESCGGDAALRASAFAAVGGFAQDVVAGEEPELCGRLRRAGWSVLRVDAEMTRHDLGMTQFGQWWRRQVRSGYGSLDVALKHSGGPFARQVRSARLWTAGWLPTVKASGLVAAWTGDPRVTIVAAVIATAPAFQALRLAVRRRSLGMRAALSYGLLTVVGKWAEATGQTRYLLDRAAGRHRTLIEYKGAALTMAESS